MISNLGFVRMKHNTLTTAILCSLNEVDKLPLIVCFVMTMQYIIWTYGEKGKETILYCWNCTFNNGTSLYRPGTNKGTLEERFAICLTNNNVKVVQANMIKIQLQNQVNMHQPKYLASIYIWPIQCNVLIREREREGGREGGSLVELNFANVYYARNSILSNLSYISISVCIIRFGFVTNTHQCYL